MANYRKKGRNKKGSIKGEEMQPRDLNSLGKLEDSGTRDHKAHLSELKQQKEDKM